MKVTQSCLTLCDPMDYTAHGILQTRTLQWVAFPFSRGSSQPRDQTQVSCTAGSFFTSWAVREAHYYILASPVPFHTVDWCSYTPVLVRSTLGFCVCVINRSFVGSKLEQTIRIVYVWYSVHIIKLKKLKTCIKQNTGEKIIQLKRYSGKALCSFDYSLYPTGLTTLTKIIQTF